jgi:hypothetical protein
MAVRAAAAPLADASTAATTGASSRSCRLAERSPGSELDVPAVARKRGVGVADAIISRSPSTALVDGIGEPLTGFRLN